MPAGVVLMLAALSGASAVGLGAFGAHALKSRLVASDTLSTWETAVQYHLVHALALLVVAVWLRVSIAYDSNFSGGIVGAIAVLFFVGIVLFSGSLYGLALGGPRWLGPVTPLGGLCFIVGWGLLLVPALASLRTAGA